MDASDYIKNEHEINHWDKDSLYFRTVVYIMEEYAKQKCIEQKGICVENFPVEGNMKNIGIRVKIWESKLATE